MILGIIVALLAAACVSAFLLAVLVLAAPVGDLPSRVPDDRREESWFTRSAQWLSALAWVTGSLVAYPILAANAGPGGVAIGALVVVLGAFLLARRRVAARGWGYTSREAVLDLRDYLTGRRAWLGAGVGVAFVVVPGALSALPVDAGYPAVSAVVGSASFLALCIAAITSRIRTAGADAAVRAQYDTALAQIFLALPDDLVGVHVAVGADGALTLTGSTPAMAAQLSHFDALAQRVRAYLPHLELSPYSSQRQIQLVPAGTTAQHAPTWLSL